MGHPLLDNDNSFGLCTLLEKTSSRLFSRGCGVTADLMSEEGLEFGAAVFPTNSNHFAELTSTILSHSGGGRLEPSSASPILIELDHDARMLDLPSPKLADLTHALVNRFLRAYEHTYLDMRVPRHRLDGRTIVLITEHGSRRLDYAPITLDLDGILEEYLPPHPDVEYVSLAYLMGSSDRISSSWRILVDGARHFESGNLSEAVLCACSAAEISAVPAVEKWLVDSTLRADSDAVRNVVREMGNPFRFELCLSNACTNAFRDLSERERRDLLTDLRGMNTLRNGVVHRGVEPSAAVVASAIRAAARFVCQIWLAELNAATGK